MWDRKAERTAKYNRKKQQAEYKKEKPITKKGTKNLIHDSKQIR